MMVRSVTCLVFVLVTIDVSVSLCLSLFFHQAGCHKGLIPITCSTGCICLNPPEASLGVLYKNVPWESLWIRRCRFGREDLSGEVGDPAHRI